MYATVYKVPEGRDDDAKNKNLIVGAAIDSVVGLSKDLLNNFS